MPHFQFNSNLNREATRAKTRKRKKISIVDLCHFNPCAIHIHNTIHTMICDLITHTHNNMRSQFLKNFACDQIFFSFSLCSSSYSFLLIPSHFIPIASAYHYLPKFSYNFTTIDDSL